MPIRCCNNGPHWIENNAFRWPKISFFTDFPIGKINYIASKKWNHVKIDNYDLRHLIWFLLIGVLLMNYLNFHVILKFEIWIRRFFFFFYYRYLTKSMSIWQQLLAVSSPPPSFGHPNDHIIVQFKYWHTQQKAFEWFYAKCYHYNCFYYYKWINWETKTEWEIEIQYLVCIQPALKR